MLAFSSCEYALRASGKNTLYSFPLWFLRSSITGVAREYTPAPPKKGVRFGSAHMLVVACSRSTANAPCI